MGMHMDEGVGRQGYRVLAGVIAVVGIIGLVTAVYAFRPQGDLFQWLGFGLVMAAMTGLLAVTLVVLNQQANRAGAAPAGSFELEHEAPALRPQARPAPVMETPVQSIPVSRMRTMGEATSLEGKPLPKSAPKPAAVGKAAAAAGKAAEGTPGEGIEFDDARPAARAAPEKLVLPEAFDGETPAGADAARDPTAWPERRPPQGRIQPGEMELRAHKTLQEGTPTVMAKVWYPQSQLPRGWNKGRCGDCGTQLMAPPDRPIHLRCPQCDKITTVATPTAV